MDAILAPYIVNLIEIVAITLMDSIDLVKRKGVRLPGDGDQGETNIIVMKIFL